MKKNLICCKGNLGIATIFLALVLFSGCGKDDKSVTSDIPPSYFALGMDTTQYLNAVPRNLSVEPPVTPSIKSSVSWVAPALTTNLIYYKIYTTSALVNSVNVSPAASTNFFDSYNTTSGMTYSYTVTSVFTIYDSVYNFYTEVESLPSAPYLITR